MLLWARTRDVRAGGKGVWRERKEVKEKAAD